MDITTVGDKLDVVEVARALDFADDATAALQHKIYAQHNKAVRELSEVLGTELAKEATVVDYPDRLQTDVIWTDVMKVTFHTRREVYEDNVKFVTGAQLYMGDEVHNLKLGAFNVRKG